MIYQRPDGICYDHVCTEFEVSVYTCYEDNAVQNVENGVVRGHY